MSIRPITMSDASASSYETFEDVITVSSYEDIEKEDSDSSYETFEEVSESEYDTIEEEIVVSDYVTDDEDEQPKRKSQPPVPPLTPDEPEAPSKPTKKAPKKKKIPVEKKRSEQTKKNAPAARKPPPNDMDEDMKQEESDSHSEASDADDESEGDDHKHKPKPKRSDAWDPNPEDAPASPTNNMKPVERIKWNTSDYYRGDTECFNAWRQFRPEKAKKKKRIERIEIVSRRVQTKPRRVYTVRRKKEKPPHIVRIRHTRQIVQKTRIRKVKEKPPPIARPKQPKAKSEKKPKKPENEESKKTSAKEIKKEKKSKTETEVIPVTSRDSSINLLDSIHSKEEPELLPSPPEAPKIFSDLVSTFSKGGAPFSPAIMSTFKKPGVKAPGPTQSASSAPLPKQEPAIVEQKEAKFTLATLSPPTVPVPSNTSPAMIETQTKAPEKEKVPTTAPIPQPKEKTTPKITPSPEPSAKPAEVDRAARPKKKPAKPMSDDDSSQSSISSGSDSEQERPPLVQKKNKAQSPPKPPPKALPEVDEPENLQRANTSELYTAFMVRDCEKEPTMSDYQRLAEVTEKYFTRYLKKEYKGIFYDVKVSVKNTKFDCAIPSNEYNVYVEWDIKARFPDNDTGDLRGVSTHIKSKSKVPSDYELLRCIVNSMDMALLEKIGNLKKTPFGRVRGMFMEEVVKETIV